MKHLQPTSKRKSYLAIAFIILVPLVSLFLFFPLVSPSQLYNKAKQRIWLNANTLDLPIVFSYPASSQFVVEPEQQIVSIEDEQEQWGIKISLLPQGTDPEGYLAMTYAELLAQGQLSTEVRDANNQQLIHLRQQTVVSPPNLFRWGRWEGERIEFQTQFSHLSTPFCHQAFVGTAENKVVFIEFNCLLSSQLESQKIADRIVESLHPVP